MTLAEAIENMVTSIMEYCSDTFDAGMCCVERSEAEAIAALLIARLVFDRNQCPGNSVDGVLLQELLDEVRNE